MGPRSQETLLQVASTKHLALGQGDVAEVVTGRTALVSLEGIQLTVIDKWPMLHTVLEAYVCTTQGRIDLAIGLLSTFAVGLIACREGGVQIQNIYLPFEKTIHV